MGNARKDDEIHPGSAAAEFFVIAGLSVVDQRLTEFDTASSNTTDALNELGLSKLFTPDSDTLSPDQTVLLQKAADGLLEMINQMKEIRTMRDGIMSLLNPQDE